MKSLSITLLLEAELPSLNDSILCTDDDYETNPVKLRSANRRSGIDRRTPGFRR